MIIIQQDSSKTLEQWTTDIFFSESFYKIKNDLNTHQYTNIPIVKFKIPSELEDLMNFKVNPEAVSKGGISQASGSISRLFGENQKQTIPEPIVFGF
ncbi:hypothetical protein [Ancylomarina sp.]|uniref:hypothetical protein n=1 Tax=Ancylomarina sp. TaxID=1970196 RepID=UPI0035668895